MSEQGGDVAVHRIVGVGPLGDLVLGLVTLIVVLRMALATIRDHFDERRPSALSRPRHGVLGGCIYGEHVVSVDRDTGDQTTLRDSGSYTATETSDGFVLTLFSIEFDRHGLPPWRQLFTEYEGSRITVKDARLSRSTDALIFER